MLRKGAYDPRLQFSKPAEQKTASTTSTLPTPPIQKDFNQLLLLKKMNVYLSRTGSKLISEEGYCHGLSILWLKQMARHQEDWMYDTISRIIQCEDDDILSVGADIEKLFKRMDKKQNPQQYSNNSVKYTDVDQILKAGKQSVCDGVYSLASLEDFFMTDHCDGNMFCVSTGTAFLVNGKYAKHSIAVYVRDSIYYLYDANYRTGRAKMFPSERSLVLEIQKCLYSNFHQPIPTDMNLEIKKVNKQALRVKLSKIDVMIHEDLISDDTVVMPSSKWSFWSLFSRCQSHFKKETQNREHYFLDFDIEGHADSYEPLLSFESEEVSEFTDEFEVQVHKQRNY